MNGKWLWHFQVYIYQISPYLKMNHFMRGEIAFSVFQQFFDITDNHWSRCNIFSRFLHYFLHLYFDVSATDLSYKMKFCSEIVNFPFYDNLKIIVSLFSFYFIYGNFKCAKMWRIILFRFFFTNCAEIQICISIVR